MKYQFRYDRLPRALFGLAKHQLLKRKAADSIAQLCRTAERCIALRYALRCRGISTKLDEHKRETLGCVRFIASLSRVDGFVLLDRSLVVHGFGVETRSDCDPRDIYIAADAKATPRLLRQAALGQYGTGTGR